MRLQGAIFDGTELLMTPAGTLGPGAPEFLSVMKMEGVWMYMVSEGDRRQAEETLRAGGLETYFRGAVSAGEFGMERSAPELYEKALRRLREPKPAVVVFTQRMDTLRRVREAGFRAVLVSGTLTLEERREALGLAEDCLQSLTELSGRV